MFLVKRPTRIVHYCRLWKGCVAHFRVNPTSPGESLRALFALSDRRTPSRWKPRLQKKVLDIDS